MFDACFFFPSRPVFYIHEHSSFIFDTTHSLTTTAVSGLPSPAAGLSEYQFIALVYLIHVRIFTGLHVHFLKYLCLLEVFFRFFPGIYIHIASPVICNFTCSLTTIAL